jgi:hypothetical protein
LAVLAGALLLRHNLQMPCTFSWRVGKVDARFNLTDADVRAAAETGARVWQEVLHRKVIKYDSVNGLPIDLIYDYRQANLENVRRQLTEISTLNEKVERLRRLYEEDPGADEFTVARLNQAIDEYNRRITEFNARPPEPMAPIGSFERMGQPGWWWKGMLHRLPEHITVYQVIDKQNMGLILAHEFGHGLGLQHVPQRDAIMQPFWTPSLAADTPHANATEAALLSKRCGRR